VRIKTIKKKVVGHSAITAGRDVRFGKIEKSQVAIGEHIDQISIIYNDYSSLLEQGKTNDIPEQILEKLKFHLTQLKKAKSSKTRLSANYFYTLGRAAFYKRDFSTAENYLVKAIKQDSNNLQVRNLLLSIYATRSLDNLSKGRYEEIIVDSKKAEQYSQYKPIAESLYLMGYVYKNIYLAQKDTNYLEKAKEKFEIALALSDTDDKINRASALNGLGDYFLSVKNYDAAIGMFLKAIEKIPNYAAAHHDLAMAYEAKMDEGGTQKDSWRLKAIEEWKKAVFFGRSDVSFSGSDIAGIEQRILALQQA
jgi:tetratricopeptide (TPR) repeat protein